MEDVTNEELSIVEPILNRLLWAKKETLQKVQEKGINITPCNFYSSTPSIDEIENSFEYSTDEPPYLDPHIFDEHRFLKVLKELEVFSHEFNPPVERNEFDSTIFYWDNDMFSSLDALAYYCFVRLLQPSNIVEIGSGFSTLVALEAIEKNGGGAMDCIEPYPRDFLKTNKKINLHQLKAQDVHAEFLNDTLNDGDILFIDSTHTVKSGSDCLHIYLRLLPKINRNIYVHVHDVFLPFGLPQEWLLNHKIFWTEQYLLLAFLIDNPKASLVYGSNFNLTQFPAMMDKFMTGKYLIKGGSVWFSYNGNTNTDSV